MSQKIATENGPQPVVPPQQILSPQSQQKLHNEMLILFIKNIFQRELSSRLSLLRVTAPMFVRDQTGINDDLNGTERPVSFTTADGNIPCVIVHSLAKWKRMKVSEYDMIPGTGIYTDMNAIRPMEKMDELHSIYVDQYDWELVMKPEERNLIFLYHIVNKIYDGIYRTAVALQQMFHVPNVLPQNVTFIHSEELERQYPTFTPQERENFICRVHKAVFIVGIGFPLRNGRPHDTRASDYDSWCDETVDGFHGLNGDLLVWSDELQRAVELSSMGIRVNRETLEQQLNMTHTENRRGLLYHRLLLEGKLKQTIGGGIGQSRLCMVLLHKKHISEVQASVWTPEIIRDCEQKDIKMIN